MGNFVFNSALGRVTQLADNVEQNAPSGSLLEMHAWVAPSGDDDVINNAADIAAVQSTANILEATNSGYATQTWSAADLTITVNDTTNLVDIDSTDITFTAIVAGDVWTDVTIAYDSGGASSDANTLVLTFHDFAVTPNGGDITAQFASAGWFNAT